MRFIKSEPRFIAMAMTVLDRPLDPVGYEQKTSFDAAAENIGIKGAVYVLLTAEGGTVRWRDDGTDPTSLIGTPLPDGQDFWYTGNVSKLRVIGVDASSILNINGYK